MAWIESHQELARHRKTKRLARKLEVSIPTALGHLHLMWYWVWDYAKDGCLSKYDAEDIADGALWEGDPDLFLNSLIDAGWIDRIHETGQLSVHDWEQHGGRLLKKMAEDAQRKKNGRRKGVQEATNSTHAEDSQSGNGELGTVQRTSNGQLHDGIGTSEPHPADGARNQTKPYLTIPNQTIPNQTGVGDTPPPAAAAPVELNPYRLFEQEGFGTITPIIADQLTDLANDFGDRWLIEAMKEARISGKRNLRYVTSILERYRSEGVDEPWRVKRQSNRGANGKFVTKPKIGIIQADRSELKRPTVDQICNTLVVSFRFEHKREPTTEEMATIRRKAEEHLKMAN
jgi:DnaD/phage-associated family protein